MEAEKLTARARAKKYLNEIELEQFEEIMSKQQSPTPVEGWNETVSFGRRFWQNPESEKLGHEILDELGLPN